MFEGIDGPLGIELWKRADKVLPGGLIYISRSARMAGYSILPGFIKSAEGCRITDVDGKEYIDFLCGNGPSLLGYRNNEVDAEAYDQAKKADLTSFYPELIVDYAECLLKWFDGFGWAVHGKNGSDVVSLAKRVMRNHTRRPMIVLFEHAYHGIDPEFALFSEEMPRDIQNQVIRLPWNDTEALYRTGIEFGNQVAGILLNPLDQNPGLPVSSINQSFAKAIDEFRKKTGALLTIDDVRHGFRLHPHGSHKTFGLQPDLLCLGKAMANGYATSALLGTEELRESCSLIQFTASYMFSPVAYRAGIKTLKIYERDDVFNHLVAAGKHLVRGLDDAAKQTGHNILISGPPTMPTLIFNGENGAERAQKFSLEAAKRGAIFHPSLNWNLCGAHKPSDIEEAIHIAKEAFSLTPLN
jgi:glutamate-1-semialdehyde 2,1-aminomutase